MVSAVSPAPTFWRSQAVVFLQPPLLNPALSRTLRDKAAQRRLALRSAPRDQKDVAWESTIN
jgi:hypothetical protein